MVAKKKIVRNEFGGFSPVDAFGNIQTQSAPAPTKSTPAGAVNQFGEILQIPGTKPTTEDLKQTKEDISALGGEALNPNRVTKFFLPQGEVTQQEFRKAQEEAKIISEGGRKANQPAPEPNPLPTTEQIPILPKLDTGIIQGSETTKTMATTLGTSLLFRKIKRGEQLTPQEQQQVDQLSLNSLDLQIIKSGDADINEISAVSEALPIVNTRIRVAGLSIGIPDLIGKNPSAKVDELLGTVDKNAGDIGEAIDMYQKTGDKMWLQRAEDHKKEIIRLEHRIKLLGILSPEIQGNPDKVNEIQRRIQDAKGDYPELNWYS